MRIWISEKLLPAEHTDVELHSPQTLALTGPSGCGKTTLLHRIIGLRRTAPQTLELDEQDVTRLSASNWADLRAEHLSLVPQSIRLAQELTARENIALGQPGNRTHGSGKSLSRFFEGSGLQGLEDRPCRQLSQGQQQRVAILRAILRPFDWLLLDEAFSNLDDEAGQKLWALIQERAQEEKAGIVLTELHPVPFVSPNIRIQYT